MAGGFHLENLGEWLAAFHQEMTHFDRVGVDEARARAHRIKDRAQEIVGGWPADIEHGKEAPDETADSIDVWEVRDDRGRPAFEVGVDPAKTDNEKALSIEYGTSVQPARPYMRPALAEEGG
jgi:hypothetical protein